MAVLFFHRLVVTGSPASVAEFARRARRTVARRVGRKAWTERVPFSFEALQAIAPIIPIGERTYDPYELRGWPIRRLSVRRSEVRYQFETRDMEMVPVVRTLSRKLPRLTFRLMTFCPDDGSVESYEVHTGRVRRRRLSEARIEYHWDVARRESGLEGDAVYEDDGARWMAEGRMWEEALAFWEAPRRRPREWWNRPKVRDIEDEQIDAMIELQHGT